MQFTNVFLATAYFFFSVTPMVANAQCNPGNFGGRRMALYNSQIGRVIGPKWPALWRIREDRPGYVLDPATRLMTPDLSSPRNADDNNDLVLTRNGSTLEMAPFSPDSAFLQHFGVTCNDCEAGSATGCTISTTGLNPQCVSVFSLRPTDMNVQECIPGANSQTFEFEEAGEE
ncbi:hypothetical protein WG66_000089 [Moniliophthora roreri]|nr:hypothetical protein WG66_000089 [Moniliophthora roreri]